MTKDQKVKKNHRWLHAILATVVVLALMGVGAGIAAFTQDDAQASGNSVDLSRYQQEKIRKDLTVHPDDILPAAARCLSDEFIPNSLAPVKFGDPNSRWWSNAVSTPFTSLDKDEVLRQLFAEHCGNPTELDMSIKALAAMAPAGVNIGSNNPWMGEFEKMADQPGLRRAFLTQKEGKGEDIFVTAEYQRYAAMVNTLLLAFQNAGIQTDLTSAYNWEQPPPVVGELPRTRLSAIQENLPVLVLEYTAKGQCQALVRIGYNMNDKRFEGFNPPTCVVPPTTHQVLPGCQSNCSSDSPPPHGGCKHNCGSTGGKDHRKSPVSSDPNDPDERVRPVRDAPPTVIRPPGAQPTQPPPPPTIPDPPEVQDPEPILPGIPDLPPTPEDPVDGCDNDGDGIPDDTC